MSEFATLDATRAAVWARLSRGVVDRRAAARHPVLATVGAGGGAEARVVVLRGADQDRAMLTLYTDGASVKVAEIAEEARGTLLIWDARASLQMRLRVLLSVRAGRPDEWAQVPDGARAVYGGAPAPGAEIEAPEDHEAQMDAMRFAVIEAEIAEIETLHLGRDLHRRAVFRRDDGFKGSWIAP